MTEQPERVGPYRIVDTLGYGGMGTVYEGIHDETQVRAAVKVLPASMSREPGFVERFEREISALEKLQNPHIVELYESRIEGALCYYAMEFVGGETLTDRLRREKRLPWQEVIRLSRQIASALKSAHDAGIIHRDLKPSNLLLTEEGDVKLADFGVAQIFASRKLTATGGVVGTAEFMSPEQGKGRRVTHRSDLYSLGAVMYAMLTGRAPFRGKSSMEVIHQHQFAQFDRPGRYALDLPSWLDQLVCDLLEKDPDQRPPDAFVVMRRLDQIEKKVALSQSERDSESTDHARGMDESTTRAAASPASTADPGEVGPTLMRDLVRAELEGAGQHKTLKDLLDNGWVLALLLILVVGGAFYWFRSGQLTPEQRFERGAEIMEQPAGPDWIEAREKYFDPLLVEDEAAWKPRVEPYLQQIRIFELERSLTRAAQGRLKGGSSDGLQEPQRLLTLALKYQQMGDRGRAHRLLKALSVMLQDQPEMSELQAVVEQRIEVLQSESSDPTVEFLAEVIDRARTFDQEGRTDEARSLWRTVLDVYADDPAAAAAVAEARAGLGLGEPQGLAEPQSAAENPDPE